MSLVTSTSVFLLVFLAFPLAALTFGQTTMDGLVVPKYKEDDECASVLCTVAWVVEMGLLGTLLLLVLTFLLLYTIAYLIPTGVSTTVWPDAGISTVVEETVGRRRGRVRIRRTSRVLVAIAHPDDEVMFFGPTITSMLREGCDVYVLCFSYGNYEELGWTRKQELWDSCRVLRVPDENITIINNDYLQDGQKIVWPVSIIAAHIQGFVSANGIDMVVTFDKTGVSGHINHIAVYSAAVDLLDRGVLPERCTVYTLESVGWIRQYLLNLFNIPIAYFQNQIVLLATWNECGRIADAMRAHKSQMLWYRHLHVLFSMYLFMNVLQKVTKS